MKIFWAWQSDLPGKISRHFVHNALLAAINRLKEPPEIEEPSEEARRSEMHLDTDRRGLPGSPDLASSIFAKIDAASVFVGDVTPVGKTPSGTDDDGAVPEAKPIMNPNVAIELGYALARLTDARVLMVLNTAYGGRETLPFDIKHKAGPIIYHLAEGASRQEMDSEKARLVATLVEALRAYIPAETPTALPEFKETQPQIGKAFFFHDQEVLAENRNREPEDAPETFVMPFRSVLYLRVTPTKPLPRPLTVDRLLPNCYSYGAFGEKSGASIQENEHGVIVFDPAGNTNNINSLTQYFRNGEIWGINAHILRKDRHAGEHLVSAHDVEAVTAESLNLYFEFLTNVIGTSPPFVVEAGLHGVRGKNLIIGAVERKARIYGDSFELRRTLRSVELATQDKYLLEFFELVHNQSGYPRPNGLYGFPPTRK